MNKKKIIKGFCYSSIALTVFTLTTQVGANQTSNPEQIVEVSKETNKNFSLKAVVPQVDPSSPEYVAVSNEAEFREAVESDNGKTYIQMTQDIQLLQGQVVVPASKTNITIDGGGYIWRSGHPRYSTLVPEELRPPQVTDTSKQKMIFVDNNNTKEVTVKNVSAVNAFAAGVVNVANSRTNVNVTLDNVDVDGVSGVVNHNGVVNVTGKSRVNLSNTFNDITLIRSKGFTEANVVNIDGSVDLSDFNADDHVYRTVFRMYASNGFSPNLNILSNGNVISHGNTSISKIQSFVWSEGTETALRLTRGAVVDVNIFDAFNNHWGLSSLTVDEGATLKVKRAPGKETPNTNPYATLSLTKGATIKTGATFEVDHDQSAGIQHVFDIGAGGSVEVINPNKFDISGQTNMKLFNFPSGVGIVNISVPKLLQGWTNSANQSPTHEITNNLQAQWSIYGTDSKVVSSTVDNLESLFPLNDLSRMLIE